MYVWYAVPISALLLRETSLQFGRFAFSFSKYSRLHKGCAFSKEN